MEASVAGVYDFTELEKKTSKEILRWAGEQFGKEVGFSSSFSPEDVIIIDILARLNSPVKIFTLDTGRLNDETYKVMETIRNKYGITIEIMFPDGDRVEKMVKDKGFYSFYKTLENRKECCRIRKIEPLGKALAELQAWITGLRREQSETRIDMHKVEIDKANNSIYKINPLIDWTEVQVWEYISTNEVPYNELFDKGYKSVGCAPCTRAVKTVDDQRAGRWWWESPESKECGLHVKEDFVI